MPMHSTVRSYKARIVNKSAPISPTVLSVKDHIAVHTLQLLRYDMRLQCYTTYFVLTVTAIDVVAVPSGL